MTYRRLFRSAWLILAILFLLQWLTLFSSKAPTWDAVSYYIYARSAVFDQDLQFENDYQLSYPTAGEHFASKQLDHVTTRTGRVANLFAVGPSMLWLPWLVILRLIGMIGVFGPAATGYEDYIVTSIATLSALWGLLSFWLAYRMTRDIVNKQLALFSTITLIFTSPLLYYQFREPMYAHAASAFTVALCVFVWWKQHEQIGGPFQALGLGALIGLAALVRWQNLSYLLLPFVSVVLLLWKLPGVKRREAAWSALVYLLLVGAAATALFFLQMSVWKVLYGSFITIPQGGAFIDPRAPFLGSLLFSSFRGILPWMPIFFFGFAGLAALSVKRPQLGLPLLTMLIVALYINGSTRDWFAGGGFGPRRLSSTVAILVVGYAAFLQRLPESIRKWCALILGVGLALQQWILLRYGIPEKIGGRVMSMEPTYFWEEESLLGFAKEIAIFVPQAWKRPLDFFILTDSPLDLLLRQQSWPTLHVTSLILAGTFMLLVLMGGYYVYRRSKHPYVVAGAAVLLLSLMNLWVLLGSG